MLRVSPGSLVRIAAVACLLGCPATTDAQTVEVTPFYGYRFGGDFFEIITGQAVDLDGTSAVGGAVNVRFNNTGTFVEGLYTHQTRGSGLPAASTFRRPTGTSRSTTTWAAALRSTGSLTASVHS